MQGRIPMTPPARSGRSSRRRVAFAAAGNSQSAFLGGWFHEWRIRPHGVPCNWRGGARRNERALLESAEVARAAAYIITARRAARCIGALIEQYEDFGPLRGRACCGRIDSSIAG